MTLRDVEELVESYISSTEHERGQKYVKHDGWSGFPWPDWMTSYLKRNNLSLKKSTKLNSARYNATKNPFVIFHYFDILEEEIKTQNKRSLGLDMELRRVWTSTWT